MTTTGTATITPQVFIGKCVVCGRRYRAEGRGYGNGIWCDCRKGVECPDWGHGHGSEQMPELDHPYTAIKWTAVKGTVTDRRCDLRCTTASSSACACSCGGRMHGHDLAG